MAAGVEVLPCRFSFDEDRINWKGLQPVHPRQ